MLVVALAASAGAAPEARKVEALRQRREGSLKVGDPAPDAAVVRLDGAPARLLEAKRPDRPLVVVFGSFT